MVDVAIYSSLKSGAQYFDDFYFVDVTDEVNIAANAGAISSLTTRVTSAEGKLTSQGSSITKLTNDLTTTINNKADAAALAALTNRVTSAEGKLESQSSSVTSADNSIAHLSRCRRQQKRFREICWRITHSSAVLTDG